MPARTRSLLADLFDDTFRLIPRTWTTSLLVGGVLLVPVAVLYAWGFGGMSRSLLLLEDVETAGALPSLFSFSAAFGWVALAGVLRAVLVLFVRACVTEQAGRGMRGAHETAWEAAAHVLRARFLPLLGQRVLQSLVYGFILGGLTLLAVLLLGSSAAGGPSAPLAAVAAAAVFGGGTALLAWLWVRWSLTLEAVVVGGTDIEGSFSASAAATRGAWWRILGCILVVGLVTALAASIVMGPIVLVASLGASALLVRDYLAGGFDVAGGDLLRMLAGIGPLLGLLQYAQALVSAVFMPVFMTVLWLRRTGGPRGARPRQGLALRG